MSKTIFTLLLSSVFAGAVAAPVTYNIDPNHTYPSFEADHFGGLSTWRGKFNKTSGKVVFDKEGKSGGVEIVIDAASIDFGHEKMNEHAKAEDIFNVAKFPTAEYKGRLTGFRDGAPTRVEGELTLHGVTKPVNLAINSFKCMINPMIKREVCGADAAATFKRSDFGISYGEKYGFKQDVTLRIQVEAIKAE